jgi:hypothetical protein
VRYRVIHQLDALGLQLLEIRARSPTATTVPTIWCPSISGSFGSVKSPSKMCGSLRQTAQAATDISSCPRPGSGSRESVSCSASP